MSAPTTDDQWRAEGRRLAEQAHAEVLAGEWDDESLGDGSWLHSDVLDGTLIQLLGPDYRDTMGADEQLRICRLLGAAYEARWHELVAVAYGAVGR